MVRRARYFDFGSYISSKDNADADLKSRRLEAETEFELANEVFEQIVEQLGHPDVDLLASRKNAKCMYCGRETRSLMQSICLRSTGNHFFYAFPPFAVILRILQKVRSEGFRGIIVVPYWPSQAWFPLFQASIPSRFISNQI